MDIILMSKKSTCINPGKPCNICGDVGFEDSLATCFLCNISWEHVYCMRMLIRDVPEIWLCEECRLRNDMVSLKSVPKVLTSNSELVNCDTLQSASTRILFRDSGSSGQRHMVSETAEVEPVPDEKVIMPASGAQKSGLSSQRTLGTSAGQLDSRATVRKRILFEYKTPPPMFSSQTAKVTSSFRPVEQSKAPILKERSFVTRQQGPRRSTNIQGDKFSHLAPGLGQSDTKATVMMRSLIGSKTQFSKFPPENAKVTSRFRPIEQANPPGFNSVGTSSVTRQQGPQTSTNIRDKSLVVNREKQACKEEPVDSLKPAKEVENPNSPPMNALVKHEKEYVCMEEPLHTLFPNRANKPSSTREEKAMKLTPSQSMKAPPIMCSGVIHADAKPIVSNVQESDLQKILPPEKYFPSYSALDATWCGSFEVFDSNSHKFYDGFWAHLPDNVHRKGFQFSKQMPGVLQCTLLPCCSIWADVFQNYPPGVNDVALYFFPGNFDRSRQQYLSLLELIEVQDLVLRNCINGVELLILPSKRLYMDPCGLQVESFLWGVCRSAKGNLTVPLLSNDAFEGPVQNFDVGTEVRRHFSKAKLENHLNVPPGSSKQAADEIFDKVVLKNSSAEPMGMSTISYNLGTTVRAHAFEVKQENDLSAPPGFSKQAARKVADQVILKNSSAGPMGISTINYGLGTMVRAHASVVKQENDLSAPPGVFQTSCSQVS